MLISAIFPLGPQHWGLGKRFRTLNQELICLNGLECSELEKSRKVDCLFLLKMQKKVIEKSILVPDQGKGE